MSQSVKKNYLYNMTFVPAGWGSVIGQALAGALIYGSVLMLMKDPCVNMLLDAVKKRVRKRKG